MQPRGCLLKVDLTSESTSKTPNQSTQSHFWWINNKPIRIYVFIYGWEVSSYTIIPSLHKYQRRNTTRGWGFITYEHTSHSSNITFWPPKGLWLIHQMTLTKLIWGFLKLIPFSSRFKNNNIQVAYFFRAFKLDEWEVRLYAITPWALHN